MNMYTAIVGDVAPEVLSGLSFSQTTNGQILLDDDMFNIGLHESLLNASTRELSPSIISTGFLNLNSLMVEEDTRFPDEIVSVVVHFKVRISRTSPPCIFQTDSDNHKPLLIKKDNDFHKSVFFEIRNGESIKLLLGRNEYLFRCKNGELEMFNLTNPDWPSIQQSPTMSIHWELPKPKRKFSRWLGGLFGSKPKRRPAQKERNIRMVHCR